ncbi:hypothetical protein SAMN05444365_10230 [Micromonospora pattaloongensis]|uniref:Uncharacterized protein n=1 Tax=Micromonospora pattaloongensis TaxID=405436 RepID=A0A1H3JBV1_9ACTN|nr:hypothetical protein [Micromonospora pattaloongensis]SDY37059.1 hypothetical protein SAMN05444365_10230 [Micromonospora pattaloongensis]
MTSSTTQTAAPLPYATLLAFTRYVGRTGPAKATFVGGLRRQRESRSGFNPHGQLVKALKADIQFRTGGTHLARVVDEVKPRWRPLYGALVPGAAAYLDSLGDLRAVELTRVRDALAMVGGLPVKINPHLGLRYDDGRAEAVRLHLDEEPPGAEALLATLHLMARHMDQVLPGAEPVVVDVRRGRVHRPAPDVRADRVERWLAGEAAAFSAIWGATA